MKTASEIIDDLLGKDTNLFTWLHSSPGTLEEKLFLLVEEGMKEGIKASAEAAKTIKYKKEDVSFAFVGGYYYPIVHDDELKPILNLLNDINK